LTFTATKKVDISDSVLNSTLFSDIVICSRQKYRKQTLHELCHLTAYNPRCHMLKVEMSLCSQWSVRSNRGSVTILLNLGIKWRCMVSITPQPL